MGKPHVEGPDFDRLAEGRQIVAEAAEYRADIKRLLDLLKMHGIEIQRLWAVLEKIGAVCNDNAAANCDQAMALAFVRSIVTEAGNGGDLKFLGPMKNIGQSII